MNTVKVKNIAFRLLTALLTVVVLFHLCLLVKLIPYSIAWGGRLENDTQMYVFETISILINVFLIIVLFLKMKIINHRFSDKFLNNILWVFLTIFLLNTIGNLFAKTNFEKYFSILTLVFALLIWIVVKRDKRDNTNEIQ